MFLDKISGMIRDMQDFRKSMTERYRDDPEAIEKLLVDIACILHAYFNLKPDYNEKRLKLILKKLDIPDPED